MDMMTFVDTPFGDQDAFKDFLFNNSRAHHDVATKLEQMGHSIDAYPLTDMSDENDWKEIHNQTHQQEFSLLGLIGLPDLSEVDLKDEQQYDDWMQAHADAHFAVNTALGLF